MNLTVLIQPPFEPVTLAEVYAHLRLDPDDSPPTHPDDPMLERQIKTARIQVEKILHRSIIEQTLRLSMNEAEARTVSGTMQRRCCTTYTGSTLVSATDAIDLFMPPLISVASVSYYDTGNELQTVDAADYYVTDSQLPQLRFTTTPSTYNRSDAIRIDYVAGYQASSSPPSTQADYVENVPANYKDAILIGVQLLYDELSPEKRAALEMARFHLLSSDIVYRIA